MIPFDTIIRWAAAVRQRRAARRQLIVAIAVATLLAGCADATYKTKNGNVAQDLLVHITLTTHVETSDTTTYPSGGHVTQSASATWTVSYTGQFSRSTPHVAVDQTWDLEDVTGSVSWDGSGPNGPLGCSGTVSRQPHLTEGDVSQLMTVDPPSGPVESEPFSVKAYVLTKTQVQSSDTNPADAQCNTEIAIGFLSNGPQQGSVAPWARHAALGEVRGPFVSWIGARDPWQSSLNGPSLRLNDWAGGCTSNAAMRIAILVLGALVPEAGLGGCRSA